MKGIDSRFLNSPDEYHCVDGKANQLRRYKTAFAWLDKYTGVYEVIGYDSALTILNHCTYNSCVRYNSLISIRFPLFPLTLHSFIEGVTDGVRLVPPISEPWRSSKEAGDYM